MKKFILWFIGIGAGLLLSAWLLLVILQHTVAAWPEPVPGVRLEPRRPILAEANVKPDNAYYYIRQMTKTGCRLSSEYYAETVRFAALAADGGSYPLLETELKTEAKNLEIAHAAAVLPDCQVPTAMNCLALFPEILTSRDTAPLLLYRAESAAVHGDWRQAAADIRALMALGNHIPRGGTLIHRLVGIAFHSMATNSMRRLAGRADVPPEFLKDMDVAVTKAETGLEPLDETMRYEWKSADGTIDYAYRNPRETLGTCMPSSTLGGMLLWVRDSSPRQTKRHFAAVYSHVIAASTKPGSAILPDDMNGCYCKNKLRLVVNDPLGGILWSMMVPSIDIAHNRIDRERADLDCTRLVLALRRWQLAHDGKLPGTLSELVPGYISAIPEDPFSPKHEPLRYRTDGTAWAVYSVGKDGVDNGGRFSELDKEDKAQHPHELDLVFASDEFQKKRAAYEKQQKK